MESIKLKQRTCSNTFIAILLLLLINSTFVFSQSNQQTVNLNLEHTTIIDSRFEEENTIGEDVTSLIAISSTSSGIPYTQRTFFKVALSSIPSNATIHSATLHLFGQSHSPVGEEMEGLISYPLSDWSDFELFWTNQPEVELEEYITISPFNGETENHNIDLTHHIRNQLYFPEEYPNYGYCLRLIEEEPSQQINFHSSNVEDEALSPYLEIVYELPIDIDYTFNTYPLETDEHGSGAIEITITQGNDPYTYQWSDGTSSLGTGNKIENLAAGIYYITVTDNLDRSFNLQAGVGYKADWKDADELKYTAFENILQKISGYGWDESVASSTELPENVNGWIEYKVEELKHKMFGFANIGEYSGGRLDIMGGLYLREDRDLRMVINGDETSIGSYDVGDYVKVERYGDYFKFYLNGILIYTYSYPTIENETLVTIVTMYQPNTLFSHLATSFGRKLSVRVYVENRTKDKINGDIFALPRYGTSPYTYNWSNGVNNSDRIQGLDAGAYTVTVTDAFGQTASRTTDVYLDPDQAKNWNASKTYNLSGELLGASKYFTDYKANTTQSQSILTDHLNLFTSQQIYDSYNRAVISTLSAPTFYDRLDYQTNFVKATNNQDYDYTHFDIPNNTTSSSVLTEGEVDLPFKVANTQKGSLGWYYSDNNRIEPFQDKTDYPFSRIEYGQYDPEQIVRTSLPHEHLKMGSGNESKSYTLPLAGEFVYMFGYGGSWRVGENYTITPNANGIGGIGVLNNDYLEYSCRAYKTINYDNDGNEVITFIGSEGEVLATALSGSNDAGVNEYEMNVRSIIQGPAHGNYRFVDIHLPEGCESTLDLQESKGSYLALTFDIINLISGETVYSDFSGNNPSLSPGIYRIVDKTYISLTHMSNDRLPDIHVKYKLNYHNISLSYYDKLGRTVATVDPNGYDYSKKPEVTTNTQNDFFDFKNISGIPRWEFDQNSQQHFVKNITPSTPQETQFTNVFLFLTLDNAPISLNRGDGSNGYKFDPPLSLLPTPESGIPLANTIPTVQTTFSADTTTYFSPSLFQPGGGGIFHDPDEPDPPVDYCPGGTWVYQRSGLASSTFTCVGKKRIVSTPLSTGFCYQCVPDLNACILPPKRFDKKYRMVFEINAIAPAGTTLVSTLQLYAEKNGQWRFWTPFDQSLLDFSSYPNAAVAVIDKVLSETTTQVEVKLVSLSETYFLPDLNICYWQEIEDATHPLHAELEELRLVAEVKTHNLGAKPQHVINHLNSYNSAGELVKEWNSDLGEIAYVYTKDGHMRFSQSKEQLIQNKFSYINYDYLGRAIESGVVDENNPERIKFQSQYWHPYRTLDASFDHPITNSFTLETLGEIRKDASTAISSAYLLERSFTAYDIPDQNFYTETSLPSSYKQLFTRGRISYEWNEFEKRWYSFYPDGRIDWMVSKINGFGVKTIHYEYNNHSLVSSTIYQKDNASDYFEHKYTYDRIGQLKRVHTRNAANGNYIEEAEYKYYLTGGLKRIELGGQLQGIDYTYNVLGMLKAINSPNLGASLQNKYFVDPGRDGLNSNALYNTFKRDIFGMSFDYFTGDYQKSNTQISSGTAQNSSYNTQISAVRWNIQPNPAAIDMHLSYDYSYFKNGWLKSAFFTSVGPFGNSSTPPSSTTGPFAEYSVSNISYDANGNIQTLKRQGAQGNLDMDDFTYHYSTHASSRLVHVNDNSTYNANYTSDIDDQGTWQVSTQPYHSAWNYRYDADGQMTYDQKAKFKYFYNRMGLVNEVKERISWNNYYTYLKYEYDNTGQRSRKIVHDILGNEISYTWYVRDTEGKVMAKYEQQVGASPQAAEYPLLANARVGKYDRSANYRVYEFADHLGNVRATFSRGAQNQLIVNSYADYYPFGSQLPLRNAVSSPQYEHGYQGQFTIKDFEIGLDAFELRLWDSRIARWTTIDPYRQFYSPYLGMGNNPINGIDPDGGFLGPVFGSNGEYRGNTKEGYKGQIIIYDGDVNFSKLREKQLLRKKGASKWGNIMSSLTNGVNSSIFTHVVSQANGLKVNGHIFNIDQLDGAKIFYNPTDEVGWRFRVPKGTKRVEASGKHTKFYESTVENIQAEIINHEWYAHIVKKWPGNPFYRKHHKAYNAVIKGPFFDKTTRKFQKFQKSEFKGYRLLETGK